MKKSFLQPSLFRDFALLSAIIIASLFLIGLWISYETYQSQSEKVVRQLEAEAARVDRVLIIEIENASYLLESLGRQISYHGADDIQYIAKLLKSFDNNLATNDFFSWADENQLLIITSKRGLLEKPVEVADRDYVKKSLIEPWKVQIGRPVVGRTSGKWLIPIAMGLSDDKGRFLGTITISLDIQALTEKIARAIERPGISFALTTLTFTKITEHSHEESFFENHFSHDQLNSIDLRAKPSGLFSRASFFKSDQTFTFYEVSSRYPYIIFLGYDFQPGEEWIHGLAPRLLQLVIVAAFVLTLLWLIRLRVIRPVVELSEMAANIAKGELAITIDKNGPLEIEGLAQQLKKISDYLAERRRIEEELQNKVQVLRRAKEAADLTNRIKVEFLSSMSHELRTPLNTIVAFSEVMKNQYYGPLENEKYLQYSHDIHQSGQQLLELINDVMALSQAESGVIEAREKPLKLTFALTKCLRLLNEKIQQRGIEIKTALSEDLPRILIDELRMKQILINLISHSLKMTPPGGEIQIGAQMETNSKGQLQLVVSFRCLPLIGDKPLRSQEEPSKARAVRNKEEGKRERADLTGIALPLSKTLAAMNQATLNISALPGGGTIITLRFSKDRLVFWMPNAQTPA